MFKENATISNSLLRRIILINPVILFSIFFSHLTMGKKIPVVSYLCGVISRRKTSSEDIKHPKKDDSASTSPRFPPPQLGLDSSPDLQTSPTTFNTAPASPQADLDDMQNLPLPPPPGRVQPPPQHTRALSYNNHHKRSFSAGGLSKKLTSSLSMKVGTLSSREDFGFKNKKKLHHEDSVWKKTIILGEKCRVPEEDDDAVYYDENGNRVSSYRPKSSNIGSCSSRISGHLVNGALVR